MHQSIKKEIPDLDGDEKSSSRKRKISDEIYEAQEQDDEILIRETQTALKNLSGSWTVQGPSKNVNEDSESFQNLFDARQSRYQYDEEKGFSREKKPSEFEMKRGSAFKPLDTRKPGNYGYPFEVLLNSHPELKKTDLEDYAIAESKQYTVLQPAAENSRAASAIKDVREKIISFDHDQVSSSTCSSKFQSLSGLKGNSFYLLSSLKD
jgi:hypothetical protein